MIRLLPLSSLLLASVAPASAAPTASPLGDYVRARVADAQGNLPAAAAGYAAALAARPGDAALALRAYRQAVLAGDRGVAVHAAGLLAKANALPPDGRLLLCADAIARRDWAGADAAAARIQTDDVFAFTVPILRAWIAFGAHRGDPLAILEAGRTQALTSAYVPEQRALLLLAMRRADEGVTAIRALGGAALAPGGGRAVRLKLAAAAALRRDGRPDAAAALIAGPEPALEAARALLAAGRPIPAPIETAADGVAELFARVAVDINRERVTPLAVTLARLGTFLAPGNAETWLVTGELLAAADQPAAALQAIAHVGADDPFAAGARTARLQLLVRTGETRTALAEAQASVPAAGGHAEPNDWTRIGDLQTQLGDTKAAIAAYTRALALAEADPAAKDAVWTYVLQLGGAQEQAGAWADARATLARALALAPDEPAVLNYLGYAQLERRENLPAAEAMIAKASALRPNDTAITDSLGWAYYVRGDLRRAIATLERAVVAEPGEPTMNEHLGDAYWSAGRRVEARYAWRAALVHAEDDAVARIGAKIDVGLSKATAAP